jgi:hypothetical protein
MHIAICIKGVHYMNGENNWYIDYEKQINNFYEMIVNPLKIDGNIIDIFLSTYQSNKLDNLKDSYKTNEVYIQEFNIDECRFDAQYKHHMTLYNNVKKYSLKNNIQYDLIITTRFDLEMNHHITKIQLKYDTFNISFKQPYGDADDCLWVFPGNDIDIVISALEHMRSENKQLHKIESYYTKKINFLVSVDYYSEHPIFNLKRTVRDNVYERCK